MNSRPLVYYVLHKEDMGINCTVMA